MKKEILESIIDDVIRTENSSTLYDFKQPVVVIVEYHKYQTMLEMLQELGEEDSQP